MLVSPGFLIVGAVASLAPLILHLVQRRRRTQIDFPTIRFLEMAEKQSSRRMRLESILLWLLRTGIMLVLGLAFAMPVLRAKGLAWLGDAPRDVAIVVDASYSMDYRDGRGTVWSKAIALAGDIIEGLGDNDRFCLYLAREQPEALIAEPIGVKEEGLRVLKTVVLGTTASRLEPAIREAKRALENAEKGRQREFFILTDNQAVAWQGMEDDEREGKGGGVKGTDGKETRIALGKSTHFIALLGSPTPENLSVGGLNLFPPFIIEGSPARVRVQCVHTGLQRESTLRLIVDGKENGRRPVQLGPAETGEVEFTLPPLPAGDYPARIEVPEDGLVVDDAFYFLLRVEDRLPVLCLGSEEDTFYVRTALTEGATGASRLELKRVEVDQLGEDLLHDVMAVFLCNALPLPGQSLIWLEEYVKSGGLLVLFPGMDATVDDYRAWTCLPAYPVSATEVPALERDRTLNWTSPSHSLLRSFQEGLSSPNITIRRSLVWDTWEENTQRVIAQGPEHPFLLDRTVGNGRVLMFAVSADRGWSDLPLSPFFLPLIVETVEFAAGVGVREPFVWATESLSLPGVLPKSSRETILVAPSGGRLFLQSAAAEGKTHLFAEGVTAPGIYHGGGDAEGGNVPVFAVNMQRAESDLTPVSADDVEQLLAVDDLHVVTDAEMMQQAIVEHRVGRTYGEHLLWVVLLLVGVEFFYANRLSKQGPPLSRQLQGAPAGRMNQHVASSSMRTGRKVSP